MMIVSPGAWGLVKANLKVKTRVLFAMSRPDLYRFSSINSPSLDRDILVDGDDNVILGS
jgi:hypothetical protein